MLNYLQTPNSRKRNYRTRQMGSSLKYQVISIDKNKDGYWHSLYPKTILEWNLFDDETRNSPCIKSVKTKLDSQDIANLVDKANFKILCDNQKVVFVRYGQIQNTEYQEIQCNNILMIAIFTIIFNKITLTSAKEKAFLPLG